MNEHRRDGRVHTAREPAYHLPGLTLLTMRSVDSMNELIVQSPVQPHSP